MKHWYKSAPMKGILLILEHNFCSTGSALCCIYFDLSGTGVWEESQ